MSTTTGHIQNLPHSSSLDFIEGLYADFLNDPGSVPREWAAYFETQLNGDPRPEKVRPTFRPHGIFNSPGLETKSQSAAAAILQDNLNQLIRNFRIRGHMAAAIDPLGIERLEPPELEPLLFGLSPEDMHKSVSCERLHIPGPLTVQEMVDHLRRTYCRSIGVQYMYIDDIVARRWLQKRMESTENRLDLDRAEQVRILTRLIDAVTFEEFLHRKFIGAKSFSLDGCESLIPLLDLAVEEAGSQGVKEIVLGMAHRGRLNVLANIMGKNPREIFREFTDKDSDLYEGRGDVKYHLGYSSDFKTLGGPKVHLSLCFNPSHLEFVNPVALGRVRAKQDRVADDAGATCMGLLIHGDAAFIGEGVIQETLNLSTLPGYATGGTLHVIVNNQIGFTTSPVESRSTTYASDIAKMLDIPIFHVNGEDPEAVAQVVRLAMDFRKTFRRDVVIDMYGYRRLGHNETDEPSFTQPVMYRAISKRKTVLEGYLEHLLKLGKVTREEADTIIEKRHQRLERYLSEAHSETYQRPAEMLRGIWRRSQYVGGDFEDVMETGVDASRLKALLEAVCKVPTGFKLHPKVIKLLETRKEMAKGERPLDWATAELAAFASLAFQGHRIRLSGQDCRRGTFSHRHAYFFDYETGHPYCPLQHIAPTQAPVEVYNSPLSETGVLGFDYGYSLDYPDGLTLWEAQFGDFVNTAQVIIDQFICSAEDKWNRLSGIVMLLPHGFEGMGPEHSSARLERFLVLAAEDNMQICNPTTPAQYFHLLRRQVLSRFRKPLVVMSPKSLLRHPDVVSSQEELVSGGFQPCLPDPRPDHEAGTRRILLCSGKVYYELLKARSDAGREDVAILRLEQLYPFSEEQMLEVLKPYPSGVPVYWVQEEPENMGAWRNIKVRFGDLLASTHPLRGISRPASASPATGSPGSHRVEQAKILEAAFQMSPPEKA